MSSIHEMNFKEQKSKKPSIEELCEHFLTDTTLKEGMARLLELSRELKMSPRWYAFNSYKCSYKGKRVVSYSVGGKVQVSNTEKNWLRVSVSLADKQDLERVLSSQPEDVRNTYLKDNAWTCGNCSSCDKIEINISGQIYNICRGYGYVCYNPTPEQFRYIEKLINIRREYINNTTK